MTALLLNEKPSAIWKRWLVVYGAILVLFIPGLIRTLAVAGGRTRSFSGAPDLNDVVDNWYFLFGHSRIAAILFLVAMGFR